jgi:hypothetical protein
MSYGQQLLAHKQALLKLTDAQIDTQTKVYNQLDGQLQGFKKLSPADQASQWPQYRQQVLQVAPHLANSIPQGTPTKEQLDSFDAMLLGGKNSIDNEMKNREVTAKESEASTAKVKAETEAAEFKAKLPNQPLNRVTQEIEIATNPQIQASKEKVAAAEGAARANLEASMARGSNAALANVPPHLIAPATADATKAGTEYAQARSVTERINKMVDAARKGNVVSYQLIPEEGALQVVTAQGIHRINMAEIQNYGGGSLWQRMQGHIGKELKGASIPTPVLNDMVEIQKIMAEGSFSKYDNSLKVINQNYGSNFRPIDMESNAGKGNFVVTVAGDKDHPFDTQAQADAFKKLVKKAGGTVIEK